MIAVFGATGQVGSELRRLLPQGHFLSRDQVDLCSPGDIYGIIARLAPSAVINAAAYTAVDRAEDEEELARAINGIAPGRIAKACSAIGIPLVHISTDYVYDGSGSTPVEPGADAKPASVYGRTKLEGDLAVQVSGATHVIFRTSWVFSSHGKNFVKTMLSLAAQHTQLRIVSDQIGGPTSAASIARACITAVEVLTDDPAQSGLYHFAGAPDTSWADFAREIFSQSGRQVDVVDIGTSEYPTRAVRPLNSRLDCGTLDRLGLTPPDWKSDLGDVLKELKAQDDKS